jgi:hypothetical protein
MGSYGSETGFFSLEACGVLVVVNNFEESSRQRIKGIAVSGTEPNR